MLVEQGLDQVLAELRPLEPIFHTKAFGLTAAERERRETPDYLEVGASGAALQPRLHDEDACGDATAWDAEDAGWRCWDFGLRQLGPGTMYLLTYTVDQAGRITRRATVWRKRQEGWTILYHQGTW